MGDHTELKWIFGNYKKAKNEKLSFLRLLHKHFFSTFLGFKVWGSPMLTAKATSFELNLNLTFFSSNATNKVNHIGLY